MTQPAALSDSRAEETESRQLMAAFSRLSRTYEVILHAASDGIFSLDLTGRITFANPAATSLLGWAMEDLLGQPVCQVVHGEGAHGGQPCPLLGSLLADQSNCRDIFRSRDGAERVVEYSLALVRDEELSVGTVLVFRDIGERERAERALQVSLAALRESNERLAATRDQLVQSEKLAAIGRIAAGIAHEINSPLGYIGANVSSMWCDTEKLLALVEAYERAAAAPGDSEALAAVAEARQCCDLDFMREDAPALLRETGAGLAKVGRIVRELREYASAGDQGEWDWAGIDEILDAALSDAFAREDRAARISREYEAVPLLYCLAVPLRQALAGILTNGLQALDKPEGVIVLRIRSAGAQSVRVEIQDDGIGIPEEHLCRVRDPFFTTRPVGVGIGMGLAVADSAVRRHGGRLDIASRPGAGTLVVVSLPVQPPSGAREV